MVSFLLCKISIDKDRPSAFFIVKYTMRVCVVFLLAVCLRVAVGLGAGIPRESGYSGVSGALCFRLGEGCRYRRLGRGFGVCDRGLRRGLQS